MLKDLMMVLSKMLLTNSQKEEIINLRNMKCSTLRPTVAALEEILYEPIQVLDHGFVRVVDYMGDDSAIVQAARVSYGKGTKKISEDQGLINYLMRHHHSTPFEMCEIKLHVKLPIFVARQWVRHRTANINEYSARYSILDKEFYIPSASHLATQSDDNKQGRGKSLSEDEAAEVLSILRRDSESTYSNYMYMLNLDDETGNILDEDRSGIARELARMNLTLNYYTQWYWKIDLNNLLHFLKLRADSHAQYEIRVYAEVILDILKRWVPSTYNAFLNYRLNSVSFSAEGFKVLKRLLNGENVEQAETALSKREWVELMAILQS